MDTTVIVACVSLAGVLGAAAIAALTQVWLRSHVGKSNGEGTLVEMVSRVLERQGDHEGRLRTLEDKVFIRGG